MNITLLLEMAADAYPERIAVTAGSQSLSYAQLLAAARAAGILFSASAYEYIALLDVGGPAVPVVLFGAAYAGKPYVPLNYRLTAPELNELLERIAPAIVIGASDYRAPLSIPGAVEFIDTGDFLARVCEEKTPFIAAPDIDDAIAVQLFTSGTTGKPKAALLRHDNVLSYILGTVEFGGADEGDAILVTVPPYHIAGISAVLSSTYATRRMVQLANFSAREWLGLCRQYAVSNAFLVPTMLTRIVEFLQSENEAVPPGLRAIAYGGGKMPLSVIERAMALMPEVQFTNAYGLTETSSTIALLGPEDHRIAAASTDARVRQRLASVGRPLDTVELQVRDAEGQCVGADVVGDIFVRGAQVAGEYRGLGRLVDDEGWFATRDRGYLDAEGYLFLDGRADDIIVRGAENISPGEIEAVLMEHDAVADAAVVAIPSELWGEAVAAAVVLKPCTEVDASSLQAWVRERLRSSRVPEHIVFRQELPYNDMGKLLRRIVREQMRDELLV